MRRLPGSAKGRPTAPAPRSTRCDPSCPAVQLSFAFCSDVEAVDDVADVPLARHQSVNTLNISRHLGFLAKGVAKGVDGGGVPPLRIADYPFAIPACEEDGRDHSPLLNVAVQFYALLEEGYQLRLIGGIAKREDADESGDGAIDANGGFHGGAPGLALCRQGGQDSAGEAAGNEGPTRQPGLDRRHGDLLVGPRLPIGRFGRQPPFNM